MSIAVVDRIGRTVLTVTGSRTLVVVAVAASVSVMVVSVGRAGPTSPAWPALVLVILAAFSLAAPDAFAGLVTLVGYGVWWAVVAEDAPLGWAFAAGVAGLVFHLALAHAAAGPAGAGTEPSVWWSLVVATVVVVAGAAALVVVVAGLEGRFQTPAAAVGIALVLVGTLPWLSSAAWNRD